MPSKNFIVAIELGSTKITGIAGQKNHDGSFTVNAVVKEDSSTCIRKGVVYNADKTVQCIVNIINRLRTQMKTEISQVYVGVGGRSIHSERNIIVDDKAVPTKVTQDIVVEMMDRNRVMQYSDSEILDVVAQEYKVDNQFQLEPVGIECTHLEGVFLNILQRRNYYRNLNECFDRAGVQIAEMYLAPFALADAVLYDQEKRSGCVLVDLGAQTTTVLVYHKNLLRHMAVIPLGSDNITKDLTSLQIEESEAETLKLRYASAYTEENELDPALTYSIDKDRKIESRKFIDIVEARVQEIVQNVLHQIPADLDKKLLGGIILTGGGSNMKNIVAAFRNHSKAEKIRVAQTVNYTIHSKNSEVTARNGQMNTILGLLAKGELNCAGNEIIDQPDIFGQQETPVVAAEKPASAEVGSGKGRVPTAEEKRKAEEERKAEEARKAQEEADHKAEEEARKPKKPSLKDKFISWIVAITKPDEE